MQRQRTIRRNTEFDWGKHQSLGHRCLTCPEYEEWSDPALDNDDFDGVYICGEEQRGLVCLAGALTMLSDIVEVYTRQEADLRLTEARMFSAFLSRQSILSHAQRHSPTYPPSPHLWTCQKLGSTLAAQIQTTITGVGTRVSSCKPSSSCNPDAIGVTSKGSCISPRHPAKQRASPLLSQEQSYL